MWVPKEIRFSNLLSHKNTLFVFKQNQMILLLGKIEGEVEGADSNGAGKSVLIDAIRIAITGTMPRGMNKDAIIMYGEQSAPISFLLQHSVTKEDLTIYREINRGSKSNVLEIFENEKPVKGFDKMKRTAQQYIYEKLGITEEDFLAYFLISQEQEGSFVTATDGQQKEVISRFSNYNKIEPIIERIKQEIKQNENEIAATKNRLELVEQTIINIKEIIEELTADSEYSTKKENLNAAIATHKMRLQSIEEKISLISTEIEYLNKSQILKRRPQLTVSQAKSNLTEIRSVINVLEDELNNIKRIKSQLAVKSGKVVTCPKCKWQFLPGDDMTKQDLETSKAVVDGEFDRINEQLLIREKQLENCKVEIKSVEEFENLQNSIKIKQERIDDLKQKEKDYKTELKNFEIDLKNLKSSVNKQAIQTQLAKSNNLQIEKDELEQKLVGLQQHNEELNFHLFSFEKQFRTYIANRVIRTIQDLMNFYLAKFRIEFRVLISGYTLLKSGELREKIQITVLNGNRQTLLKGLSGGQRARVALTGVIALQKLINNTSSTGGLDLLGIDEFLSALDVTGQNEAIKTMEESKITSILIMHHASDVQAKNKVTVKKKDDISVIEEM